MNILFVSDNKIWGHGGGCLENRKYYDALKKYSVMYNHNFKVISTDIDIEEKLPIEINKSRNIDIEVRLHGHSSFLYNTWKRNLNKIIGFAPDIVFLGRSRLGFIAKSIKKNLPNCKVITNVDNVEWDYVDAYFAEKKGIFGFAIKTLERFCVCRDEKDCIKYSDQLIFLTNRNIYRYMELYCYQSEKSDIIPICLSGKNELTFDSDFKTVIFIGSLDYAANSNAAKILISNIWKGNFDNEKKAKLIIAGRNPSAELEALAKECSNITLIANFNKLSDFVPRNALMLAPIEKGAGMKVKVAETLSMGLMIAGSDEALVGYEQAINEMKNGGIIRANSVREYVDAINKYFSFSENELELIRNENTTLFDKYYTYSTSQRLTEAILNSL